jgi:hypothetical protein
VAKKELQVGDWVYGMDCWGNVIKNGYVVHVMRNWGKASVAAVLPGNKINISQCYLCNIEPRDNFLYTDDKKDMMELALFTKDYEWCRALAGKPQPVIRK